MSRLTFDELRGANAARCRRWHPGWPDDEDWTVADWSNAMCGEAGELANAVKKLRRVETGNPGANDGTVEELIEAIGKEAADVAIYLDLLTAKLGIDLGAAIASKFNEVSDREGFPEKLPTSPDGPRDAQGRLTCTVCGDEVAYCGGPTGHANGAHTIQCKCDGRGIVPGPVGGRAVKCDGLPMARS